MAIVTTDARHYSDIATAIRAKTGKADALKPAEMAEEIDAISTGGDIDVLIDRSITEMHSQVTSVGRRALSDCGSLTTANFPMATSVGEYSFFGCVNLTTVDIPRVTKLGSYAFQNCRNLTTVNLPAVTELGVATFYTCVSLKTADFPMVTSIPSNMFRFCNELRSLNFPLATSIGANALEDCRGLTTLDFPLVASIASTAFQNCVRLTALILRKSKVVTLSTTIAFKGTPIESGTGYIYVPSDLVSSYKTATNWATHADQIRAIEDYPEITGGAE